MTKLSDHPSAEPVRQLNDVTIRLLAGQLRGITSARVRFIGSNPDMEKELMDLLLGLGVPATIERIGQIAPAQKGLLSFRFSGNLAIITVALDVTPA